MNPIETTIPRDAVITVAGTVGVGKSTITKALAEAIGFKTSFEKVDTNPYLDLFYQDFERWSFHLQIYFLGERFKEQQRIYDAGGGFIQDRSIYEDTDIFARMHYENGTMNEMDYRTYVQLFEAMVMTPYFPRPDLLIYLDGSLDDIITRIHQRGRPMEQATPNSYWVEMYERYHKWIESFNACPVLRLNINEYDLHDNPDCLPGIIRKIESSIQR